MKFLLVFVVVLIGFFVWRSNRVGRTPPPAKPAAGQRPGGAAAIEMIECDVCGLHCPKTDSVAGKRGVYCTAQHRSQAEP